MMLLLHVTIKNIFKIHKFYANSAFNLFIVKSRLGEKFLMGSCE